MAEEEPKKVTENVNNVSEPSPSLPDPAEKAVAAAVVAQPPPASVEEKLEDSKALVPIVASNFLNKIY